MYLVAIGNRVGRRRVRVVVIGGSGLIGMRLVAKFRGEKIPVVAASPTSGVNTYTGSGLADVLTDTQIVIDVSNSPSFEDSAALDFFETSGRNLAAAEHKAGVEHHVVLSVIGQERNAAGYFIAKMAQERLVRTSGIPYTIIRSAQFFEFLGSIADGGADGQTVRMSPALVQPIAADDVASMLAVVAMETPTNDVIEIAGPQAMPLDAIVREYLAAQHDERSVVADPNAPYFGIRLNDQSLTPSASARIGPTRFVDWLNRLP
jgi:uncharacterized protein YbjT (DUF2867 family)